MMFARSKAPHRLVDRVANVICGNLAEDKETCRVGMSCQSFVIIGTRKDF
jgi:hypothetical protein